MHKHGLRVALVAVLTVIFLLGAIGVAFAAEWPDLSLSILGDYGVTEQQVANISEGFPNGSWQPYAAMPRKQFVKMAVDAYKIPLVNPATPTYSDVPASNFYYQYIEAATAAGLTNGVGGGKMEPDSIITREQASAIIVRWVADKNGYNLATMYTASDAAAILSAYPDASAVGPSLVNEMAFAVDFGIVWGDASGTLAPKTNLSRIQGAAMLIRSLDIIPFVPAEPPVVPVVPTKIELVSDDQAENLIGLTHQYTYKVTQANGSAAPGVLVDFDTQVGAWFVGNVEQEAALTDANGEVTANLISTEVGTEVMSASAPGVAAVWSTKYWLALDEVYILSEDAVGADPLYPSIWDSGIKAENNAGDTHTWSARVVVFGPGPLSTNPQDWYNEILPTADYVTPKAADGIDGDIDDGGSYGDELDEDPYVMRSLPGIPVKWSIVDVSVDDPDTKTVDEGVASVGNIVAGTEDAEIAADGQSAWTYTDADGLVSIDIMSEQTGQTLVQAVADYEGNPYSSSLFNHDTMYDDQHDWDWDDQPAEYATALKTWIPHIIGSGDAGPITPAYAANNTGEVETYTLTLKDVFGNAISDYSVEWWIQGVGFFKTDGSTWVGAGEQNKDMDWTDADGQTSVLVKSLVPGQTVVHAKVTDKYGAQLSYNALAQWYSIDKITFNDPRTKANEAVSTNTVGEDHTFTAWVFGDKWVFTSVDVNNNGLRDDRALLGLRESEGGDLPNDLKPGEIYMVDGVAYTRWADYNFTEGEFWYDLNGDGVDEAVVPLPGKGVDFFTNVYNGSAWKDTPYAPKTQTDDMPLYVGSIKTAGDPYPDRTYGGAPYDYNAITDADGSAWVTITSTNKGYQDVYAVADYPENPQDGVAAKPTEWYELRWAQADKTWEPEDYASYKVFDANEVVGNRWVNPVLPWTLDGEQQVVNPNTEQFNVQVFDKYGNALEGYYVTWEIVGQGTTTPGQIPTYHPYAHFMDTAHDNPLSGGYNSGDAGEGDLNPFTNVNPWWGTYDDGTVAPELDDNLDADWAWGWTLDHEINWTLTSDSAANTTLVLDETYGALETMLRNAKAGLHFTDIVNVKIYTPSDVLIDEFEITKEWAVDQQVATSIVLQMDNELDPGHWITTAQNVEDDSVLTRGRVLDQWGNPLYTEGTLIDPLYKVRAAGTYLTVPWVQVYEIQTNADTGSNWAASGWAESTFTGLIPGVDTLQAWYDTDNDGLIDAGELASNILTATVLATP